MDVWRKILGDWLRLPMASSSNSPTKEANQNLIRKSKFFTIKKTFILGFSALILWVKKAYEYPICNVILIILNTI